jgi:hypothetical protein
MNRATKLAMLRNPNAVQGDLIERLYKMIENGRGEKGDTPVKYVDYYTPAEVKEIIDYVMSQVRDGAPGEKGETGAPGKSIKGNDGETPIRGVHYMTDEDIALLAKKAAKLVKVTPVTIPTAKEVHDMVITTIDPEARYDSKFTELDKLVEFLKRGGFRGGGSTSTGGVSTIYNDTVSGLIDGTNKIFTVAHTIQSPVFCSLANSNYQAGIDYTVTGPTQITFVTAPDSSLAGQPFWLAHS